MWGKPETMTNSRYRLNDPSRFLSPSLVIDRTLLRRNLEAMIVMARGADRLRPHVKTHKMPAIVRMCEAMGIHKHKCATIAEAEMAAAAGGTDVLLAYPLVGPNIDRYARLIRKYPATTFRALVDHPRLGRRGKLSEGMQGARPGFRYPCLLGRPGGRHGANRDRARRRGRRRPGER